MPRPKPTPRRCGGPPPPPPPSPRPRARRRRPGQRALQEIRRYQSSTHLVLCPGPFARLVQELCLLFTCGVDYSWQRMALLALQEGGVLQDSPEGISPQEGQVEAAVLKDNGDSDGNGIA
ncbi:histone H3-like centromeric protein A [Vidua chalybeata]|uniref:histone H3-like centromeric protein A n=1 Tax=Vidua chalybeata TaxID=81927 RepID=UPI0023A7A1A7|nr:histone H3-like centromeric protein A [Vidua chalybeata]